VRKRLERMEAPWPFYMRREIAFYRALGAHNAHRAVRVPRMLDAGDAYIVLERIAGKPLAQRRHVVPRDRATWEALIAVAREVPHLAVHVDVVPTPEERAAMRARLLEDPTAPIDWIASGLRACAKRGLIDADIAERLAGDLKNTTFQHGDLLLRNVMRDKGGLVVIDWECAGLHAEGWDAALLSVFAPEWARRELARGIDPASLRACTVFAILRELVFRRGKNDDVTARLESELALALV
jgi:aminoglycoside phosphotransferase (APT) family kinase protein